MNPAVHAWSKLALTPAEPVSVELLKDRRASHVYRLAGVGPDGSHVIAKRCPRTNALAEQAIYKRVLRDLPGLSLRYYGLVPDADTDACWMFVEDAAGVPYSPKSPEHGRLAAEWLARLHTLGPTVADPVGLPDQGPGQYLTYVRSGPERIRQGLANPALGGDDYAVLDALVELCAETETLWPRLEAWCAAVASTFVHADLHAKNIHVSRDGSTLLPYDWESAGWGPPAIDLGLRGLDLEAYRLRVRCVWPELTPDGLERLAVAGRLFQLVAHVEWEARGLDAAWLHRPMKHMRYYRSELAGALRAAEAL